MLHSAPSLSVFTEGLEDDEKGDSVAGEGGMKRTITIGERIDAIGSGDFNFGEKNSMGLIEEEKDEEEEGFSVVQNTNPEQVANPDIRTDARVSNRFIADSVNLDSINLNDGDDPDEFYQRMIKEFPNHPLFLRNYAQFLQSKGDLNGAEDYYHRATLADPDNGEILSQYGKLVWELHHDQEKALSYFERAVQASPGDCNILAAYASFLWETDDGEEEEEESANFRVEASQGVDTEDYYRKMVELQPKNSSVLRNYARFLCKTKQDLQGAEEYYLQAIEADPNDGEIMLEYAKMVWQHHRDHCKASDYFERAVHASPQNSDVHAAYALFLWETEEDETI